MISLNEERYPSMTTDLQPEVEATTDERDLEAAAKAYGVTVEYLKQIPKHEMDCSLVTTHHLTCTCGAYGRRGR